MAPRPAARRRVRRCATPRRSGPGGHAGEEPDGRRHLVLARGRAAARPGPPPWPCVTGWRDRGRRGDDVGEQHRPPWCHRRRRSITPWSGVRRVRGGRSAGVVPGIDRRPGCSSSSALREPSASGSTNVVLGSAVGDRAVLARPGLRAASMPLTAARRGAVPGRRRSVGRRELPIMVATATRRGPLPTCLQAPSRADARPAQVPVKLGARFSRKALGALLGVLAGHDLHAELELALEGVGLGAARGSPTTDALMLRTASGPLAARRSASSRALASASPSARHVADEADLVGPAPGDRIAAPAACPWRPCRGSAGAGGWSTPTSGTGRAAPREIASCAFSPATRMSNACRISMPPA